MFKFFQNKSASSIIKKTAKAVCIFTAVFSLTVFSGCDLIGSLIGLDGETPDVVTVSPLNATIEVGGTITLTATSSEGRAISWSSSDDEIAEVDGGEVTGISVGEASITASDGKKMATCEITVIPAEDDDDNNDNNGGDNSGDDNKGDNSGDNKGDEQKPQAKITLSSTAITILEGASYNLMATASDGSAVEWSTSNRAVATVDKGNVSGVKAGTATITASSATAKSATCTVTVIKPTKPEDNEELVLVWGDEFNGSSLDMSKWGYQTGTKDYYGSSVGPDYWGNGELQYYTDGANVKVSDGVLEIIAKRENMGDRQFTSARILTRDKFSRTYGYFEARIKTPAIDGMWPAFWMLPQPSSKNSSDNIYGGWPNNGEIDIMEAKGRLQNKVDCTLHFGRGWQNENHMMNGTTCTLNSNTDEWHTYAVDWREKYIAWIVDGKEVLRVNSTQWWTGSSNKETAPFDQPFFILINLAVGGMYDGNVQPPASFMQASMYVDYVRVYEVRQKA